MLTFQLNECQCHIARKQFIDAALVCSIRVLYTLSKIVDGGLRKLILYKE